MKKLDSEWHCCILLSRGFQNTPYMPNFMILTRQLIPFQILTAIHLFTLTLQKLSIIFCFEYFGQKHNESSWLTESKTAIGSLIWPRWRKQGKHLVAKFGKSPIRPHHLLQNSEYLVVGITSIAKWNFSLVTSMYIKYCKYRLHSTNGHIHIVTTAQMINLNQIHFHLNYSVSFCILSYFVELNICSLVWCRNELLENNVHITFLH